MPSGDSPELNFLFPQRGGRPEQKLFGRYTLKRVLGRGGMGIVWLAHDDELNRHVAMKFLPDMLIRDKEAVNDLKRETRRSLDLTHHHIVRIYDFTQDDVCAAIIMEYVDGETLSAMKTQQQTGCFSVSSISAWVSHLCQALDYAHRQARVVHRDLKPANLMVNSRGDLKITDFGISRSMSDSMTRVSMSNTAGTLAYMSPEQALGAPPAACDDVYAFGATVYDLLTGRPPFFRGNIQVQLETVIPPQMSARREELGNDGDEIPELWEKAIASCLAKRPQDRPQTMGEIAGLLGLGGPTSTVRGFFTPGASGTPLTTPGTSATHVRTAQTEDAQTRTDTIPQTPQTTRPAVATRPASFRQSPRPTSLRDVIPGYIDEPVAAPPPTQRTAPAAEPIIEPAMEPAPAIPAPVQELQPELKPETPPGPELAIEAEAAPVVDPIIAPLNEPEEPQGEPIEISAEAEVAPSSETPLAVEEEEVSPEVPVSEAKLEVIEIPVGEPPIEIEPEPKHPEDAPAEVAPLTPTAPESEAVIEVSVPAPPVVVEPLVEVEAQAPVEIEIPEQEKVEIAAELAPKKAEAVEEPIVEAVPAAVESPIAHQKEEAPSTLEVFIPKEDISSSRIESAPSPIRPAPAERQFQTTSQRRKSLPWLPIAGGVGMIVLAGIWFSRPKEEFPQKEPVVHVEPTPVPAPTPSPIVAQVEAKMKVARADYGDGKLTEAATLLHEVQSLDPKNEEAPAMLAKIDDVLKQQAEMEAKREKITDLLNRAKTAFDKEQWADERKFLGEVLALDPDNSAAGDRLKALNAADESRRIAAEAEKQRKHDQEMEAERQEKELAAQRERREAADRERERERTAQQETKKQKAKASTPRPQRQREDDSNDTPPRRAQTPTRTETRPPTPSRTEPQRPPPGPNPNVFKGGAPGG